MDVESLKSAVFHKLENSPSLNAKVKFDLGENGIIHIDATQQPPVLSSEDLDADTVFVCSAQTMQGIMNGEQDPTMAYMMGKLKIRGSMGYAMKINAMLSD